ncbi:MAG: AAA family ATPase [Muribaculaceae bacterium]|nr:AAA family ATPase [Muribaculaceae bacterium]
MDFNKFTENARQAITESHRLARQCQYSAIEPVVMMVAIMQTDRNMAPFLLEQMGVERVPLFGAMSDVLRQLPRGETERIPMSESTMRVLSTAEALAQRNDSPIVAPEHIFWALYEAPGPVKEVMKRFGVTSARMEAAVAVYRNGTVSPREANEADGTVPDSAMPTLRQYSRDLVREAAEGSIDPVIGRDAEVRRLLQILTRKTKNNPILVGEPGTGKTAIVEGLAHRIHRGDVPEDLLNIKLFSLDFSALVAGASAQGELEERLKTIINEVKTDPTVVLFIDEIHLLIGGGNGIDAANILKPEMARGIIKVIGATTLDEYTKYIEKDKAFERRFQKITVTEPDPEAAITILRGIKSRFEDHHHIKILDEAIVAAVNLSHRYISDRFLPDKAIDLLDEAASSMRLDISSEPAELELMRRRLRDREMERESIRQDNPQAPELSELNLEIANLTEKINNMHAQWQNAREQVRAGAEPDGDSAETLFKTALDEDDIMRVVTAWTGIPMSNLNREENEKLRDIETYLHSQVIGQDAAVSAVANVIRRNRMGLSDAGKPIGTFLFLGSTGVGKTELSKALAQFLFDSKDMMVRIDMSEYQEKHNVARLIGAPPGYVGHEQGGQLTEAVRRRPYSVVLFDEIEKAHPDVFNVLLQVFDEGRLTDGKGRTVDFKNTIIIMTSNMGQEVIMNRLAGRDFNEYDVADASGKVLAQLKQHVKPEFLNRIDEVVMFLPLSQSDITAITEIQLRSLIDKLANSDIELSIDPTVVEILSTAGYRPEYGGRPVKRAVNDLIVNTLSLAMVEGRVDRNRPIRAIPSGSGGISFING